MKYQIRKVDELRQIMQITTLDERWYQLGEKFYPSSTWIADQYPKGVPFYRWLADKGWDEAEAIKITAGSKGTKVHKACEDLLKGKELKIDDKYYNESLDKEEELTPEEWHCVMTFKEWHEDYKPEKVVAFEVSGVNPEIGFGGTIDIICVIKGQIWIIDLKTSANIWRSHELQVSSYKRLLPFIEATQKIDVETVKLGILQLGYTRNKLKQYKFTEIEDKFDLFLHAKAIWEEEITQKLPLQKDYPLTLKLNA